MVTSRMPISGEGEGEQERGQIREWTHECFRDREREREREREAKSKGEHDSEKQRQYEEERKWKSRLERLHDHEFMYDFKLAYERLGIKN